MNKREVLENIIKQNGGCLGIKCSECYFVNVNSEPCQMKETHSQFAERCKKILAEMEKEEVKVSKFQVGDLVFCLMFGWGKVINLIGINVYTVEVVFGNARRIFTEDGKYNASDAYPTLFSEEEAKIKFPEYPAPKKKVKKTCVRWFNIYKGEDIPNIYLSEDAANNGQRQDRIDCVRVEIHYEV